MSKNISVTPGTGTLTKEAPGIEAPEASGSESPLRDQQIDVSTRQRRGVPIVERPVEDGPIDRPQSGDLPGGDPDGVVDPEAELRVAEAVAAARKRRNEAERRSR